MAGELEKSIDVAALEPWDARHWGDAPESVEGVHLFAGQVGVADRLALMLTSCSRDLAVLTSARDQAAQLVAAVETEADKLFVETEEWKLREKAAEEWRNGSAEWRSAKERLAAAQAEYDRAIAERRDPRPFRAAVTAAHQDAEDVERWCAALRDAHAAAVDAAARVRMQIRRRLVERELAALAQSRAKLKARCETVAADLMGKLLNIDAAEYALRGN